MQDIVISESKLEDIIYNHLTGDNYSENIGEYIGSGSILFTERQFSLGNYGIPDILTFNCDEPHGIMSISVYELKKDKIDKDALIQVLRYKAGIKKYLDMMDIDAEEFEINCILIGGSISENNMFKFITPAVNDLEIYTYDICPDSGIKLTSQDGWCFTDLKLQDNFKSKMECLMYKHHDYECSWHHFLKDGI